MTVIRLKSSILVVYQPVDVGSIHDEREKKKMTYENHAFHGFVLGCCFMLVVVSMTITMATGCGCGDGEERTHTILVLRKTREWCSNNQQPLNLNPNTVVCDPRSFGSRNLGTPNACRAYLNGESRTVVRLSCTEFGCTMSSQ